MDIPVLSAIVEFFDKLPTPLVIAVSALIAWKGITQNRKLSIQKNTLDFDNAHQYNDKLIAAYVSLRHMTEGKLNSEADQYLRELAKKKQDSEDAAAIRLMLNTWERVSRGIEHGVYDEEMLFSAFRTLVVRIHRKTLAYRREAQKDNPTYYECFEKLAYRWETKCRAK